MELTRHPGSPEGPAPSTGPEGAPAPRPSPGEADIRETLAQAGKLIEDCRQGGADVSSLADQLRMASELLQEGKLEDAALAAKKTMELARTCGEDYTRAMERMQRLDADYREVQGARPDHDYRDVTAPWTEASAAWDRGDYSTAAELARRAVVKLDELKKAQAAQKAAAPGPPPQKYRCPSCAKVFQVVPPAFKPFDVGCPHCHTVVRISK